VALAACLVINGLALWACEGDSEHPGYESPAMPSFDIVSEGQPARSHQRGRSGEPRVDQRFDFKGTNSNSAEGVGRDLSAPADFQLKQMLEILKLKLRSGASTSAA